MSVTYNMQPAFAVDDASLLETDLTTCHLLVLVGQGTFSYVVFEPAGGKFLALKSYHFQPQKLAVADLEMIERVFDADKLLFTAFRSVLLAFDAAVSTLVPESQYSSQLKKDYLHMAYPEKLQEAVLADILPPPMSLVNVYAVDKDLLGFLRKEFSTDRMVHAHSALLQAYPYDFDFRAADGVAYIMAQRNRFTITIYAGGKLLNQQEQPYQTGLDIVYHLVNTLRILGLDEQKVKVKLGGPIAKDTDVYGELHKFMPHVEWVQRLSDFQYISKMQELPAHYFHHLYALALCV
ncbi:MAG TPA: DUF3822 family protein [Chitinophaga sp.]|uniref:DUF3822 family protein n=1 Tax=Chitinophaga sp. TaxID=1869181 RepID=UPI002DC03C73|nr:DUF3822 family protein [Chitinophaga sp.]HEU4555019.1 DUF3822 family protein [Chitinophaga sp.]